MLNLGRAVNHPPLSPAPSTSWRLKVGDGSSNLSPQIVLDSLSRRRGVLIGIHIQLYPPFRAEHIHSILLCRKRVFIFAFMPVEPSYKNSKIWRSTKERRRLAFGEKVVLYSPFLADGWEWETGCGFNWKRGYAENGRERWAGSGLLCGQRLTDTPLPYSRSKWLNWMRMTRI
jgi:hypothetical protein